MSLIVQLGTTSVGYTPTLNNTTVSTVGFGTNHAAMNSTSRLVNTNQIQVAKHRLPMTINRQPQQHTLPVRNIAALARPIHQSPITANSTLSATTHIQSQVATPVVAGRVLASPVKDAGLDDDLLEGVVEKRPKYHKHLPLNYQYVLQDHNYGAPPPPTPPAVSPPPKSPISSVPTTNGISVPHSHREHPHNLTLRSPTHTQPNSYPSSSVVTSAAIFNNSRQVPPVTAVANDVESDVSSDNEREVEPEGEETETAPEGEGEGEDEDSVTRCICDFQHDDGYMICCDRCSVWQHVDCMGIDRANIPEEYLCEKCQPRRVEKQRAISLQIRKRKEFETSDSSSETSSSSDNPAAIKPAMRKRAVISRRRSEPARKPTINTAAKQRRESAKENSNQQPRQSRQQNNRKRHIEKRPPTRRKSSFSSNSVYNNNSSTVEKKNTAQPSASASVSSSISTLPTSSLSSEKINHHNDRNLTSPNVTSSGDSVQQLRQWIDSYEEAVTNHYSPELRARIANIKVNGVHSDLRLPSNLLATPKCRISLLPSGIKILMTCSNVQTNQPLIELRGKYMLCNSGGPGLMSRPPRPTAPPPPGPHIFHYKLPRDNTEVCVDCRTYGNDARFVRRSCQPNAEIRHCIEKGTLHLYIVTTASLDKNTEVTIAHSSNCGVPCICGDKDCHIKKEKEAVSRESPPRTQEKKNGLIKVANNVAPSTNSQSTVEKRRRGRRRTTSENQPPPEPPKSNNEKSSTKQNSLSSSTALTSSTHAEKPTPAPVVAPPPPPPPPPQPPSPPVSPPSPTLPPMTRSASSGSRPNKNATAAIVKETNSTRTASPSTNKKDTEATKVSNSSNNNNVNSKDNSNNENIKNNNNNNSNNNNNNNSKTSNNNNEEKERKTKQQEEENLNNKKNNNITEETEKKEASDKKKKMTREERKMEAIMKAFERMEKDQARKQEAARQAQQRKDSTDTDKEKQPAVVENKTTSNKEKEREEKEPATNNKNNALKRRKRKGRNRSQPTPQPVSRARARRAVRRTRTNSRSVSGSRNFNDVQDDSDSGNSTDNDADEGNSSPSPKKNSSSNISQAAGLLMSLSTPNSYNADKDHDEDSNHYTRRSSFQNDSKDNDEHTEEDDDEEGSPRRLNTSTSSSDTPTTPLSNTCLLVAAAVGPLAPGFKFPKTKKGLLNNWFKAPDPGSPPSLPVPGPDESPTRPGPGKKRWLRQAISEECESPNRPEMSVSPTDYVAPLKKRRLARESISSEQSFTPPATPVEPVNQLNFDDEEEEPYGPGVEKRVDFDENGGGSSAAESDVESPAGPRTPLGPEPKSEPDPIKEEKVYEDEIRVVDRKRSDAIKDDKSYVLNTPIKMEKEAKHVDFKDEFTDVEHHDVKKEKKNSTPARKKVLSISEYRQRKRQGGRESQDGDIDGDDGDCPENNTGSSNMVTSSPRSHTSDSSSMSSSDEEDANNSNLISKSILLDANATTKTGSRFSCAPTLVERQRENLTERLRREFGLFLSDDEENMAARRQSLNNELQLQSVQLSTVVTTGSTSAVTEKKDSTAASGSEKEKKRKHAPPPPPPPLPIPGPPPTSYPMYHGYPPSVRGPAVYPPHFSLPPLPPPALEPVNVGSAAPYYGPPNTYYGHPPH